MARVSSSTIALVRSKARGSVSGFIWFLWEAPLVYFGLLDSTIIKASLGTALLCHFLQDFAAAIGLGYLRVRFGSIFLPTFAHGLLNSLGGVSFAFFVPANLIWGDFGGPLGTILLLLVAGIVWRRLGHDAHRHTRLIGAYSPTCLRAIGPI